MNSTPDEGLTLSQKILIAALAGLIVGAVGAFAQHHAHAYVKRKGLLK